MRGVSFSKVTPLASGRARIQIQTIYLLTLDSMLLSHCDPKSNQTKSAEHLEFIQYFAVTNKAAVNILAYTLGFTFISMGQIPKGGITGSKVKVLIISDILFFCIWKTNFIKQFYTISHSWSAVKTLCIFTATQLQNLQTAVKNISNNSRKKRTMVP